MRRSWFWQNADTLATVVTTIAAVVALFYAHLQITEGRRAERETNVNELWRETLRLGFDNPKLSDPSLKLADFDYDKLTIDGSRELFQKYEIYVDTVLNASDEILEISPTEAWKTSLRISALAASRLFAVASLQAVRLPRSVRRTPPLVPARDFKGSIVEPGRWYIRSRRRGLPGRHKVSRMPPLALCALTNPRMAATGQLK